MGHADVAVVAALRFVVDAHIGLVEMKDYPALKEHRERLEALPDVPELQSGFRAAGLSGYITDADQPTIAEAVSRNARVERVDIGIVAAARDRHVRLEGL